MSECKKKKIFNKTWLEIYTMQGGSFEIISEPKRHLVRVKNKAITRVCSSEIELVQCLKEEHNIKIRDYSCTGKKKTKNGWEFTWNSTKGESK